MYRSHNPSYLRFLRTSAERDADPGSVAVRANAEGEKESTQVQSQMRHFPIEKGNTVMPHHVRSTPTEAVLYEADLQWLENRSIRLSVLRSIKWNSLYVEDPRVVVLNDSVRLRHRRPDWRTTVLAALSSLGLLTYHPWITYLPDLSHLGAVHHQLPRRLPMFPS